MTMIAPAGLTGEILSRAATRLKPEAASDAGFAAQMQTAVKEVAKLQNESTRVTQAFESGAEVDVTKVMLAREKASLAFEATLQIRNKLLSAYKDIVSMPV